MAWNLCPCFRHLLNLCLRQTALLTMLRIPPKKQWRLNRVNPTNRNHHVDELPLIAGFITGTILEVREKRNGRKSSLPRSSPFKKTNLKTPPRRGSSRQSLGPISSPSVEASNGVANRATSHPASSRPVNRLLNFSPERPRESIESASRRSSSSATHKAKRGKGAQKGTKVFDLGMTDDNDEIETDVINGDGTTADINGYEPQFQGDDDQMMMDSTEDQELPEGYTANPVEETAAGDALIQPATSGATDTRSGEDYPINDPNASQISTLDTGKRRGRPPKHPKVLEEPVSENDPAPPPLPSPARGRRKAPLAERDPNIKMKTSKRRTSAKPPSRNVSVSSTSRLVQRSATPANEDGTVITRYGRQSIKPLATWRGEKAILGDRTMDSLPAIESVIRVDEVIDPRPRPKRSSNRSARRRAKPRLADVEEEEEEEELDKEPWEVDPGIMMAQVMAWDTDTNKFDEANTREEGPIRALYVKV